MNAQEYSYSWLSLYFEVSFVALARDHWFGPAVVQLDALSHVVDIQMQINLSNLSWYSVWLEECRVEGV